MEQSEAFRVEMRRRWDHFDGVQEAEKKLQAARHEENVQNLQKVANKIGTGNLIIVLLGLLLSIAVAIVAIRLAYIMPTSTPSIFSLIILSPH